MENKEKMLTYIKRSGIKDGSHYTLQLSNLQTLRKIVQLGYPDGAICLAFGYGRAKGYRMGKREATKNNKEE